VADDPFAPKEEEEEVPIDKETANSNSVESFNS
jgi:hypothetical protein